MHKIYFDRMDFRYEDGQVIGFHLDNALIKFDVKAEGMVASGYEQDSDSVKEPYIYEEGDNSSYDADGKYQIGDILLLNLDSDAPEGYTLGSLTLGTVVEDSSEGITSLVVTPTFEHTWKGWDNDTAENSWYICPDQIVRKVGTQFSMRCI